MSGIYRDLGPNLMDVGDGRELIGSRDEHGALTRLSRCKVAVHGLYRAEGWLGVGNGQGEGSALRVLTRFDRDLPSMGGSCPNDDGAVGGLNCVRTLMGVGAHSELTDPQEGMEGSE